MQRDIIAFLDSHRLMTVATLRADGWPQATMVGYANEGLRIYFLVSRTSQKLRNIQNDNRISIALGDDSPELAGLHGLAMSALAYPITETAAADQAYAQLVARRPEYGGVPKPSWETAAVVRAIPHDISIVDFSKGLGHVDDVKIGYEGRPTMDPARPQNWGLGPGTRL